MASFNPDGYGGALNWASVLFLSATAILNSLARLTPIKLEFDQDDFRN